MYMVPIPIIAMISNPKENISGYPGCQHVCDDYSRCRGCQSSNEADYAIVSYPNTVYRPGCGYTAHEIKPQIPAT